MRVSVGVVSLLLLQPVLAASSAQASWVEVLVRHDDYCTVGSLRACVSVHAHSITTGDGTEVFFSVRNLQGTNPNDNTGGSAIWRMMAVLPPSALDGSSWSGTFGPAGSVEVLGVPMFFMHEFVPDQIRVGEYLDQAGIFGCDVPGPVEPSQHGLPGYWAGGWRTCATDGLDGWFTWSFSTSAQFSALDLTYSVELATEPLVDPSRFTGAQCTFSAGQSNCERGVPEPHALLLGITGLLGIVWALRRRRLDIDPAEGGP